jgi:hypothetical protein
MIRRHTIEPFVGFGVVAIAVEHHPSFRGLRSYVGPKEKIILSPT